MYDNGQGVTQDYQKAFKWISLPAEKGDAKAQFFLGCMYEDGQGVTQNYTEAIKWYTLAAEQNEPMAQTNLGHLYANEKTGKLDYVQAHKWFNIFGAKEKENIEKLMSPNQITEAQKLAREWINEHKKH
jgi:hypothetical protein